MRPSWLGTSGAAAGTVSRCNGSRTLTVGQAWECRGIFTANAAPSWVHLPNNLRQELGVGKFLARASSIALIGILAAVCSAQTGKVEKIGPLTDAAVPEAVRQTLEPAAYPASL